MINLKNLNEHALLRVGVLVAIIAAAILLFSCQKESSFTRGEPRIEADHHLMPPGGYYTEKRVPNDALQMASRKANPGKGKGKPGTDTTGGDNPTDPQPPTSYRNILYLDFDSETVSGTAWNVNGDFTVRYSGMTEGEIAYTYAEVAKRYEPLGFTVTTDRALFFLGAATYRQQAIFTESWEWYGRAGGVAYLGSFNWPTPAPCFIFTSLLGYSGKNCAYAGLHELGHTLGLRHVPELDAQGNVTAQYCFTCPNPMGGNYGAENPQFSTYVRDAYGWVNQLQVIEANLR